MLSLTYMSSAVESFTREQLDLLLATCRANNREAGLTGMLLYADDHFIQTLEGRAEDVERTFERISADPRHHALIVALREELDERRFADWSMGFETLSPEETATIEGFSDYLDPESALYRDTASLGRAGIFHRIFRDNMRYPRPPE